MKIAIIDIETTGFNPKIDCIVEMGIVELDLKTGEKKVLYDKIIREKHYSDMHKNSWIYFNSTLNHEDVMKAETINLEQIQKILSNYKLTAYNKKFDFSFLVERGLKFDELPCPMIVSTPICKIPGRYGYKWPTVEEAYKLLIGNEINIETHRGITDALIEADIVFKLYKDGNFPI